jgi:hypothetical protein
MTRLSLADWGAARDAGETTWSVGKAGAWAAAYTSFREAATATEEIRADAGADIPGLFRWDGGHGQPVASADLDDWVALTAEGDPYNEAAGIEHRITRKEPDAGLEAEPG